MPESQCGNAPRPDQNGRRTSGVGRGAVEAGSPWGFAARRTKPDAFFFTDAPRPARARVGAWTAVVAGLALAAAGCGEQQAPEARGALNVALIIPTTGELSSYGRQCQGGAKLARDEVNVVRERARLGDPKAGVPGDVHEVRLWLNIRDDHAETPPAVRTAEQLYKVAHFLAVVGPVAADSAVAVADALKEPGVNLLVPTVEAEDLRQGRPNILQVALTSSATGRLLARFVTGDLKPAARKALFVRPAGDAEAAAVARGFEEGTRAEGGFQVVTAELDSETVDAKQVVARVKTDKPGVVVAAVGPDGLGAIVGALREAGEAVPVLGGTHAYSRRALDRMGSRMGEVYAAAHFAADEDRPIVRGFVETFRAREGMMPSAAAALAYDAVKLVDEALRRAMPRTLDGKGKPTFPAPEAVGRALRGVSLTGAVTGPITINADGSATKPLFILRLDEAGGRFHARVEP